MDDPYLSAQRRALAARPASAMSSFSPPASSSRHMMPPPSAPYVPSLLSSTGRDYLRSASRNTGSDVPDYDAAASTLPHARYASKPRASTTSVGSSSTGGVSGRGSLTASSRARRLQDLVAATAPAVRGRRSDAADPSERENLRARLVAFTENILDEHASASVLPTPQDEDRLIASLKRKVKSSSTSDGSSAAIRLETTISRLKRLPGLSQELPALLAFLDTVAFTNASGSSRPGSVLSTFTAPEQGSRARSILGHQNEMGRAGSSLLDRPSSRAVNTRSPFLDRINSPLPSITDVKAPPSTKTTVAVVPDIASGSKSDGMDEKAQSVPAIDYNDSSIPRAELLRRWRQARGQTLLLENALLQDILYLLQGINGRHVGFEEDLLPPSNDIGEQRDPEKVIKIAYYEGAEKHITAPTQQVILRIAELGRLYKRIDTFLTEQAQRERTGLIMQSLCHFLSSEMTDYYRLVAILEAKMKQKPSGQDPARASDPSDPPVTGGLTLKRISVWTDDVLLRLRLLSTIIESCQDAHGGEIISLIHTYTFHGDPLIRSLTADILDRVSRPFFHTLSKWIFEGELQDPFHEFFVGLSEEHTADGTSFEDSGHNAALYHSSAQQNDESQFAFTEPSSLWQNKFRFRAQMLPSFLEESVGRKVFSTGKSLHFIRFSCGDADWVATRKTMHGHEDGTPSLRYADLVSFERNIDAAYAKASSRLLDIFLGKFNLLEHLRALKDYLMLARGDFIDLLMESIGPSLDRPAASLFRHNLTASLETAIRGSNSQYDDADIVGRLDARILEFSDGDLGWDTFTLEYRVDEPVNTVLDHHAMLGYQVIFSHLWRIKRVELALGATWERLLLAANTVRRVLPRRYTRRPGRHGRTSALAMNVIEDDGPYGHRALVQLTTEVLGQLKEQVHFVKQMQGYINLEVIEYSWNDLTQLIASHADGRRLLDLDELIQSHRAYINTLLAKVLLRGSSRDKRTGENIDYLALEVRKNLDTMLQFARAADDLAAMATDHAARYSLLSHGVDDEDGEEGGRRNAAAHQAMDALRARLERQHGAFAQSTLLIMSKLEKHSNLVVRDLATRINFNSFYVTSTLSSSAHRRTPAPSVAA